MYKRIIRPILFCLDAEKAHYFVFWILKNVCKIPFVTTILKNLYTKDAPCLKKKFFGLEFKNPIGLAAGFDKNATAFNELSFLGFGFIEIGTVTPQAQEGNPKKRLFRLKDDMGIINRMGFNNMGALRVAQNLKKRKTGIIIGGNIGKNNGTPLKYYIRDYCEVFTILHPFVDYFVLNVSCPNVNSAAQLEDKNYLKKLIESVQRINETQNTIKPILLKIAPDLNYKQLDEIIELVSETKIDGVIATNTSTKRNHLKTNKNILNKMGKGGLSGAPLHDRSTKVIRYLAEKSNKAFPIIGVGGICTAEQAMEKIKAGADLIQIYTGFVYQGVQLIKDIKKELVKESKQKTKHHP